MPRVHGSALFERGETQVLGVTTLNMLRMEQSIDTLNTERTKRYMHNYNMPPYSTGETGRVGSPKRREIGHVEVPCGCDAVRRDEARDLDNGAMATAVDGRLRLDADRRDAVPVIAVRPTTSSSAWSAPSPPPS